jgi:hypothetical protein
MSAQTFIKLVKHPLKFRLFMLRSLPSAYFSGVRVVSVAEDNCAVKVPYKWFSRNPFRSTYFACLAMAAEMSTGLLGMMHTWQRTPGVAMLVVNISGEFFKKATGKTIFTCADGPLFQTAINETLATGEARTVKACATGLNEAGETVAVFQITWSFKARKA